MTQPLDVQNLTAHYGQTKVLEDLSLSIAAGELVSLLGASGCGKTTTLRLIAGFLAPTSGTITLGGRDLTALPAYKRDIGLVFQNYALFPHLSVLDNVGFGLKQRGVATDERTKRARAMLERVGLTQLADRLPGALSGGQKQRVALARALVIEPPLMMFDEPLSNLDAKLRVDMRVEIRQLQRANNTTSVYVTHDQEEAFSISDRVAIMNAGRIMQFDHARRCSIRAPPTVSSPASSASRTSMPMKRRRASAAGRWSPRRRAERRLRPVTKPSSAPCPIRFVLATRADGLAGGPPRRRGRRPAGASSGSTDLSGPGLPVSVRDAGRSGRSPTVALDGVRLIRRDTAVRACAGARAMLHPGGGGGSDRGVSSS
jgi:putative spermidine/putrescine transport system ATP-binding protein